MLFLYSRKTQCLLLVAWLIALGFIYENTVGKTPLFVHQMAQNDANTAQTPVLGQKIEPLPEVFVPQPPSSPPLPSSQAETVRPKADDLLNIWDGENVSVKNDNPKALLFNLEYIPAKKNGFTPPKVVSYYVKNAPYYVVDFGKPWKGSADTKELNSTLPSINSIKLIITKTKALRLIIHGKTQSVVRNIRLVQKTPNAEGIELEFRVP